MRCNTKLPARLAGRAARSSGANPGSAALLRTPGRISPAKGEPFHVPDFVRGQPALGRSAALLMFSTGGEDERGETKAEAEEEEEGGGESCLNLRGARAGGGRSSDLTGGEDERGETKAEAEEEEEGGGETPLTVSFVAYASGQPRADLTSDKDLYLDNSSVEEASGVYPIDDDDYSSGSGSGAEEDEDSAVMTTSRTVPKLPTTSDASRAETTTVKMQTKVPAQTKSPEEIDKEERPEMDAKKKSDEPGDDTDVFTQKHSENLFQRTEVLAAVIAGGVIGFLFAIFLILLLVYRMRKKDEGSYDLGERKPSCAAYQKAPTKEFYA
ncbi:PREDICTED: syndecan-2 [Ficedula albicollis]|uniref:syndecan-2 n=1 Tax=Ficedula albicollis TaxID=59894 RepID=UPI0003593BBD|nr:PREDICTED: syndecan-2 [Ficedula albicollis]